MINNDDYDDDTLRLAITSGNVYNQSCSVLTSCQTSHTPRLNGNAGVLTSNCFVLCKIKLLCSIDLKMAIRYDLTNLMSYDVCSLYQSSKSHARCNLTSLPIGLQTFHFERRSKMWHAR